MVDPAKGQSFQQKSSDGKWRKREPKIQGSNMAMIPTASHSSVLLGLTVTCFIRSFLVFTSTQQLLLGHDSKNSDGHSLKQFSITSIPNLNGSP